MELKKYNFLVLYVIWNKCIYVLSQSNDIQQKACLKETFICQRGRQVDSQSQCFSLV